MSEGGLQKLYDNCLILDPSGKKLSYVNNDKKEWYLKRGLAECVKSSEFDSVIRLNFYPNIKEDILSRDIIPRENKCVCCGRIEDLSRHHVVPSVFLRHLPEEFKEHKSDFVVCLCIKCHRSYERKVISFKKEVAERYGMEFQVGCGAHSKEHLNVLEIWKSLHIVLYSKKSVEEKEQYKNFLITMGYSDFSETAILDSIEKIRPQKNSYSYTNWPKNLMNKIILYGEDAIKDFMIMWYNHFIETMNPNIKLPFEEAVSKIGNRS